MLGNWLAEFTDLRQKLVQPPWPSRAGLRALSQEARLHEETCPQCSVCLLFRKQLPCSERSALCKSEPRPCFRPQRGHVSTCTSTRYVTAAFTPAPTRSEKGPRINAAVYTRGGAHDRDRLLVTQMRRRIVEIAATGRTEPVPAPSDRKRAAAEKAASIALARAAQEQEDTALRELDGTKVWGERHHGRQGGPACPPAFSNL